MRSTFVELIAFNKKLIFTVWEFHHCFYWLVIFGFYQIHITSKYQPKLLKYEENANIGTIRDDALLCSLTGEFTLDSL